MKRFWRKVRAPLAASPRVMNAIAASIAAGLRFVARTNPLVAGSSDAAKAAKPGEPYIVALWHGQHLLAPALLPREVPIAALFSKSADAELNALVAERLGFGIVRGSGGRGGHVVEKGGARALIAMKRLLDQGTNVAMIADIPHGTPRDAGLGIVTLARISGRPILPVAVATSRRKVLEKSWDKTTINLPFGRGAFVLEAPIEVPADANGALLEAKRRDVTAALDAATDQAYRLVDGAP